jgi:hypothetical protein
LTWGGLEADEGLIRQAILTGAEILTFDGAKIGSRDGNRACLVETLRASMSPIRGECQEKILLPPLREETDVVVACIQPNLSSGEAVGSPRIPDKTKQLAV